MPRTSGSYARSTRVHTSVSTRTISLAKLAQDAWSKLQPLKFVSLADDPGQDPAVLYAEGPSDRDCLREILANAIRWDWLAGDQKIELPDDWATADLVPAFDARWQPASADLVARDLWRALVPRIERTRRHVELERHLPGGGSIQPYASPELWLADGNEGPCHEVGHFLLNESNLPTFDTAPAFPTQRQLLRRIKILLRRILGIGPGRIDQVPWTQGMDHSVDSHRSRAPGRVRKTQFWPVFRELAPF